jgi:endoglycosylceramidase
MTGVRRWLLTAVALLASLAAAPASADAAVRGPFKPDGRWLKDPHGRVVIVHGLQIAHKAKPYHPSARQLDVDDASLLRSLGFNSVRLAWMWSGLEPRRGRISRAYAKEIAREARLFTHNGVLVLLEAHQDVFAQKTRGVGFPNWAAYTAGKRVGPKRKSINYRYPGVERAFASLFRNRAGTATAFARAWGVMARAVASERGMLLGYDLFNEPWPGRAFKDCDNGCRSFDRRFLGPFQTRLARAIRAHDEESLVWYEPHLLFDFGAPSYLRRAPADVAPAGFTFHAYCRKATGGYGARPNAESRSPFYKMCAGEDRRVFANAERTAKSVGGPPLFGEFGDSQDRRHVERMMDAADRNRTGWLFWAYKDWVDIPGGRGDGSLFRNDSDTSTLRAGHADVVSRGYPEAVAGEPLRWRWSRTERRFELTYRPDHAILAPTLVSLPVQRHYRDGYRAEVEGGAVLSEPGAPSLAIKATPGASEVRVTVLPR